MKLNALVNDEKHEIDIRREGDIVFARIDGREYELEVSEPEQNLFLFKQDGTIREIYVDQPDVPNGPLKVRVGPNDLTVKLFDPKRLRGAASSGAAADGAAEIRSAMPGKVVRIVAQAGTEVEKGDSVLVVEAMKMQNELKSPKPGTVKEIRVKEGATVNAGEVLAVID